MKILNLQLCTIYYKRNHWEVVVKLLLIYNTFYNLAKDIKVNMVFYLKNLRINYKPHQDKAPLRL
jgi:hypothetical protein